MLLSRRKEPEAERKKDIIPKERKIESRVGDRYIDSRARHTLLATLHDVTTYTKGHKKKLVSLDVVENNRNNDKKKIVGDGWTRESRAASSAMKPPSSQCLNYIRLICAN